LKSHRSLAIIRTRRNLPRSKRTVGPRLPDSCFEPSCYDAIVFNFGKPKTAGDWIIHIAGVIVALFLVWWMLRMFVL
jgi:hypothetical protein